MAYQEMKVSDLRTLLQERGLSGQGAKLVLLERLRRSEEGQQQQQQQEAQLEATSPSEASSPAVLAANAASPVVEVAPLQLSLPQQPQQQPQQPQQQQQTEVVMSPGANVVVKQEPGASPIVEPMSIDEPLPTSRDRANDSGSTSTSSGGTTSTASDASSTTGGSKDNTVVAAGAAMTPAISQGVNRKLLSRMVHERASVSSHLHQYYGRAFNSAERFDYELLRQKLTASFVYTDYEIPWWCAESYDTAMGVCRVPGRPTESIVCINRD